MFKRILIPTDGSEIGAKAVSAGVALAKEFGARVIGFHAQESRPLHLHNNGYQVEKELSAELERRTREHAERCTAQIEREARAQGVPFEALILKSDQPYEAIVKAAVERDCDVIFMASHGHRGLRALLLGSVTQKVLTHSKIPVLVYR